MVSVSDVEGIYPVGEQFRNSLYQGIVGNNPELVPESVFVRKVVLRLGRGRLI